MTPSIVSLEAPDFRVGAGTWLPCWFWGKGNRLRFVRLKHWALAILACPLVAAAADSAATLTLLEGSATLVRGVTRYALVEGVRFRYGDIIEVGDQGLAETEFADGAALTMGPMTRALLLSLPRGALQARGDFYVTQGVLKVARVKKGARLRIFTPRLALQPVEGAAVLLLSGAERSVFVESGVARISGAGAALLLKAGEFYTGEVVRKSSVGSRPTPAFIRALPKMFLDPPPSRMARVRDRPAQPRKLEVVNYAEVESWLKAPRWIRRPLLARFKPRAADAAFRSALVANLRFHPEWDPILFPEKYEPKETQAQAARDTPAPVPSADKR